MGQTIARFLNHNFSALTGGRLPWIIAGVLAALVLIRAGLFPSTGGDDGEQLIFSQYFDWGYQVRNPPLYTWLVIAVSQITGPTLWTVNIVKFSLLGAMYLALWRACLKLFRSPEMAALAALSPVLFYYVGWEVITGFSHTVLVAAIYAGVFFMLVRLREPEAGMLDFAALGLLIGLGAMAKYAFWIFLASMLAAGLCDKQLRARLLSAPVLLTLAVAAGVAAPHYLWLLERLGQLGAQAGESAAAGGISLSGLGNGLRAAVGFLSPFWVIALLIFPAAFKRLPPDTQVHPFARVIGLQMAIVLAATLIGTITLPEFKVRTHYMFVLLLFPVWTLLRAEAAAPGPGRSRLMAAAVVLGLAAGPLGMAAKYLFEPMVCTRCQHHLPFEALAQKLRNNGFTGGTVIATSHPDPLPGNLRWALPEARVISVKHPDIIPPVKSGDGQCVAVWSADVDYQRRGDGVALANERLAAGIKLPVESSLITVPLETPLPGGTDRFASFGVIMLPGSGDCR